MTLSDFKRSPEETSGFKNAWSRKQQVDTPLGKLGLDLYMMDEDDLDPPDARMLEMADELVHYLQSRSEYVRELIYGSYRYVAKEFDRDWLESCEVPADLTPAQILNYCKPLLIVARNPKVAYEGPPYSSSISVQPKWEPEHGLLLEFSGGDIVAVNDSPFEIVDGVLMEK